MASPMTKVSSLVSADIANYLSNIQTWKDIVTNVKAYGAKGDGVSNDSVAIQKCIDLAVSFGGGTVTLPAGNYLLKTKVTPKSNVRIEGLSGAVIIRSSDMPFNQACFTHEDEVAGLFNFTLRNITFIGGKAWYSKGNVRFCRFEDNSFSGNPSVDSFLIQFDSYKVNQHNTFSRNVFSGSTGPTGFDMFGSGQLEYCEIIDNYFHDSNGQGFATNTSSYNWIVGNKFVNTGNGIGLEGTCERNIITDNRLFNAGSLKLGLGGTNSEDVSRLNEVIKNVIAYSNGGGIEAGLSYSDLIENNIIFRSRTFGIQGIFDRSDIKNNIMYETNYSNSAVSINSTLHTDGGINLINGTNNPTPAKTVITGNRLYTSRTSWLHPVTGTMEQGWTGGINIDSNYEACRLENNMYDNTYQGDYDGGIGTRGVKRTAPPTNGTWEQGETFLYKTPTAGGYIGGVCVSGGSPGTWKNYGAISS